MRRFLLALLLTLACATATHAGLQFGDRESSLREIFREVNTTSGVGAGLPCPDATGDGEVHFTDSTASFDCDGEAPLSWSESADLLTIDPADTTGVSAEETSITSAAQAIVLADGTTIATMRQNQFLAPTINGVAGGGTETATSASTLYVGGQPSGSNITFTNGPYNIWLDDGETGTAISLFESAIEMTNSSVPSAKTNTIFLTQGDRTGQSTRRGLIIVPESGTGHYFGDNIGINTLGPNDLFVICQQGTCTNWTSHNATAVTWADSNTGGGDVATLNFDSHPPAPGGSRALVLEFDNSYIDSSFILTKSSVTGLTREIPTFVVGTRSNTTGPTFIGSTSELADGTSITNYRFTQFRGQTLNGVAGGGSETVTNAATVYIDAAPSGSNITLTNPYALWVDDGAVRFDGTVTYNSSQTATGDITIQKADPSLIYDVVTATDTDFWAGVQDDAGSDDDDTYQIGKGTTPGTTPRFTMTGAGAISLVDKLTTYNNIATVSNGVPSEVATIDTAGLTANVSVATLYSVPSSGEGMYRVSAYVVLTTAGSVSSTLPNVQVVYSDKDSDTSVTLDVTPVLGAAGLGQTGALTANAVGTVDAGVVPIYVKASTTIQYQTVNYASVAAGMTYALHIKLEAM